MLKHRVATTPELSVGDQLPVLSLVGFLFIASLAMAYPSSAFPAHGAGMSGCLILLAGVSCAVFLRRKVNAAAPLAALGCWCGLWIVRMYAAPSFAEARVETMTILSAASGYIVTLGVFAGWPREAESPGAEHQVPPLRLLTSWLAAAVAMVAAFGAYQVLGPASFPHTFRSLEQDLLQTVPATDPLREGLLHAVREGRAASTLGAPNIFASFCVFGLPLAAAGALWAASKRARALFALAFLATATGLYYSKSSGGVLSGAGALALVCVLTCAWKMKRRAFLLLAVIVAVAGAAVLIATMAVSSHHSARWFAFGSMQQRFYYWQTAWKIWTQHPILGAGPGSFEILYPQFRVPGSNETRHAHSWFFEYGASVGVAGVALFLFVSGSAFSKAVAILRRARGLGDRETFMAIGALTAAALGIAAHGLIEYTFFFREALIFFFAALGVTEGVFARDHAAVSSGRAQVTSGIAIFILGMLAIFFFRLEVTSARAWLDRDAAANTESDPESRQHSTELAAEATSIDPSDWRNWELLAFCSKAAGVSDGFQELNHALELNPRSAHLHESLALHYSRAGNFDRAVTLQREAVALHPLDASHRMTLAEIYWQAGRKEDARAALLETTPLLLPSSDEKERRAALAKRMGVDLPR